MLRWLSTPSVVFGGVMLAAMCACNAILGIGDPIIPDAPAPDASDAAEEVTDAGEDADFDAGDVLVEASVPICAHGSRFGKPELVRGLESVTVLGARLNEAESNVYLAVLGHGGTDLFVAGRESPGEPFGPLARLSISTVSDDYWPTLDADERVLFFESGEDPDLPASASRIWFTSRNSTSEAFKQATLTTFFSDLPEGATDSAPYLIPSGNALYFTSIGRPDTTASPPVAKTPSQDLWAIQTNNTGTMIRNRRISELSTDDDAEQFPVVTEDQQEIFFTRTRGGDDDDEIWVAQRAGGEMTARFEPPRKVDEDAGLVNTFDAREWAAWISPDNCRLYFVRVPKVGDVSEARLWMASRSNR